MTAILTEIRGLEARLERGELTHAQFLTERAALMDSVEDAQTEFTGTPAPDADRPPQRTGSSALGFSLVVCLGVMTLCIGMTLLFLPSFNLALTLGVTILAALSVTLLVAPED
ncbi:SHOCT domain-containing protein [uncultured Roseobacter sp.]|uniref:SHOCT domain-containing protein n=1 Tax=uncultured Roseobacter sp. TaxID=114847 RepID=UPI00261E55A7|nr:SHOCT domain-containing protein [uncultured Roseobacter sp.]